MSNEFTVQKTMNEFRETNDVTMQGVIVHKFVTDKIAILTLSTGNATPVTNHPKALFFGELRDQVAERFEKGDHVLIKGNMQSSKKKENVKNQVMQSVFAESISDAPSVMEEAFDVSPKDSYRPFVNQFKISGHIAAIDCPAPGIVRFVVRVVKNGRLSFVRMVHFTKNTSKILSELHPRDKVYTVGCIQTSKSENEAGTRYYENCVAIELVKCEE